MKYIILLLTAILVFACTYDVIEVAEVCSEELLVEIQNQGNSACGAANGSFVLDIVNSASNIEEFTFQLNNNAAQSSPSFEGLTAGSYAILVSNGICETTVDVDISNEDGLSAVASSEESACGEASGSIDVSFSNASGEVQFSLDGGAAQSNGVFSNLPGGEYVVSVTDEGGCSVEITTIVENESNYESVEAIISGSCAVSGCHAGNVSPDLRVKNNIIDRSARILARTSAGTMPPSSSGMSLSSDQVGEIECWVESGSKG